MGFCRLILVGIFTEIYVRKLSNITLLGTLSNSIATALPTNTKKTNIIFFILNSSLFMIYQKSVACVDELFINFMIPFTRI